MQDDNAVPHLISRLEDLEEDVMVRHEAAEALGAIGNRTDVNIILCKDQSESDIKRNGCKEENIVYRQIVNAIMPIGQSDTDQSDPITLLYMVEPGNHDIVVVVDPDNTIVETDENNKSSVTCVKSQ